MSNYVKRGTNKSNFLWLKFSKEFLSIECFLLTRSFYTQRSKWWRKKSFKSQSTFHKHSLSIYSIHWTFNLLRRRWKINGNYYVTCQFKVTVTSLVLAYIERWEFETGKNRFEKFTRDSLNFILKGLCWKKFKHWKIRRKSKILK